MTDRETGNGGPAHERTHPMAPAPSRELCGRQAAARLALAREPAPGHGQARRARCGWPRRRRGQRVLDAGHRRRRIQFLAVRQTPGGGPGRLRPGGGCLPHNGNRPALCRGCRLDPALPGRLAECDGR